MTRTALGTLVCMALLASAGTAALADPPAPSAFPAPIPAETTKPSPKPDPSRSFIFKGLVPPEGATPEIAETYDGYNRSRSAAESKARKAGLSNADIAEAIRKDSAVQSSLADAQRVVSNPKFRPAEREPIAAALNAVDKPEEAARLSAQSLAQDPDDRDALNNMAQARYSLGQYRDAIENATRVMKKDPDNESAYTTRALSRYYSGDYLQASEDARRALALNKGNDIALATLRMAEQHVETSALKLDAVASAQAEKIKAEYQASLESRNQVEADAARRAAPGAGGLPIDPLTQQAAAKISASDHHGSLAIADKAIAADPNNAEAWYLRAQARNAAGDYEKAVSDATQALKVAPGHALAFGARAKAQHGLGRWQAAVDDANESIRLDPTNAYAFATRARAFEKLGDLASMLASFQQAARINRQFEPDYQKAAARHALPPPPSAGAKPARAEERAPRPLWVLMLSTLLGGCLIAIGLFHVASTLWSKKITTAIRRLEEARASITPPSHELGALAPHFQIVRAIGKGGMGVVYEAIDKGLNRRVALKKMRDEIRVDPRERERFLQEARTVAGLHHPNIVDIHAIVEEGGELCLVFEYVSGRTVEQFLEQKKRLSLPEARVIMRGVCGALDYAHKRGVIHRDLKPSNVMLTDEQEVKVMDFGIARHAKDALSRMTITNTVAGTPPYMAPEADQGVVRAETDVYALGACLYEMLTGERPFPNNATTSAKQAQSYAKPTRLRRDLPAAVDALIDAALQPDPEKRIPSASRFLAQLEAAFSVPA